MSALHRTWKTLPRGHYFVLGGARRRPHRHEGHPTGAGWGDDVTTTRKAMKR